MTRQELLKNKDKEASFESLIAREVRTIQKEISTLEYDVEELEQDLEDKLSDPTPITISLIKTTYAEIQEKESLIDLYNQFLNEYYSV